PYFVKLQFRIHYKSFCFIKITLLEQGDFDEAEALIVDSELQLYEIGQGLNSKKGKIDEASQNIANSTVALQRAEETSFLLIQPDLSQAKAEQELALSLLYQEPEQAAVHAENAERLAQEAVDSASNLNSLAHIVLIAAGIVAFFGLLYYLYKKEEA
ncbi:hypothetical protein DRN67_03220, partial [Candidatus Micrarchaeota archaeon]